MPFIVKGYAEVKTSIYLENCLFFENIGKKSSLLSLLSIEAPQTLGVFEALIFFLLTLSGFLVRRKLRRNNRHMEYVRSCLHRRLDMRRLKTRLANFYDELTMEYVADKRDKMIQSMISKESQRLDSLHERLTLTETADRRNFWLSEDDIQAHLVMIRHNFEAISPPKFRCADPSRKETYVMPEHYEKLCPEHSDFHLLLLDKSSILLLFDFVARTYGICDMLWTLNFWSAVEGLRSLFMDTYCQNRLKGRMLQICDKYISPSCVNPACVSEGTRQKAVSSANELRQVSLWKHERAKCLKYGRLMASLQQAQWEAFLVLKDKLFPPFSESGLGRAYLNEIKAKKRAMWKKDEVVVKETKKKEFKEFAKALKQDVERRIRIREDMMNNKAEFAVLTIEDKVKEMLLHEVCAEAAVIFNNIIEAVLEESIRLAIESTVEYVWKSVIDEYVVEVKTEQTSDFVAKDMVLPFTLDWLIEEAVATAHEQREKEIHSRALTVVDSVGSSIVDALISEAVLELRKEKAILTIQCFAKQRLAMRQARKQVAKYLIKRFDPDSGYYYYMNTLTNETYWYKPSIIDKLFPQAKRLSLSGQMMGTTGGYGTSTFMATQRDSRRDSQYGTQTQILTTLGNTMGNTVNIDNIVATKPAMSRASLTLNKPPLDRKASIDMPVVDGPHKRKDVF